MTNTREMNELMELNLDVEEIKERLIVRPLNWHNVKEHFENVPFLYRKAGKDMILAVYIVINDDKENGLLQTGVLPLEIIEDWNEDEDEIFTMALENTQNYAPARLYTNIFDIEHTPELEANFMADEFPKNIIRKDGALLVTTNRKTNGAIAMFYPGVKDRLADLLDGNYYVAFTSIHEAMIHREGTIDPVSIRRNVRETNRIFGPDETLTNEVWFFNKENGTFEEI
ncbi:MAG: hypothetical protein IKH71_09390 [Oscillospiraceae bacterium]|nr:hypothetical protein [Oscillospiraceae bacterium]